MKSAARTIARIEVAQRDPITFVIVACRAIFALSRPRLVSPAREARAIRDIVVEVGRAIQSSREVYRDSWCCYTMNT
jgi:hypothetical protein